MNIEEIIKQKIAMEKKKRGTYWTDLVKECVDVINKERYGSKFPQVSFIAIRSKVAHLDDASLSYLVSICKDAKNRKVMNKEGVLVQGSFSKVFFGVLKVRK